MTRQRGGALVSQRLNGYTGEHSGAPDSGGSEPINLRRST